MKSTGYIKIIISVLMASIVVLSVLVPIVYSSSMTTTTTYNDGVGWGRYTYYDEAANYDISTSSDGSTLNMGAQSGTASDMIIYASDVFSVLYAGNSFQLIAPAGASADLGASASISSSAGTVTVANSNNTVVYSSDNVTWAYVPDDSGNFGFFDDVGATIGDYSLAAAGSFAGAYTYNENNTIGVDFIMNSLLSDGAVTSIIWEKGNDNNDIIAVPFSQDGRVILAGVPTPTYTDGEWGFNISGSNATIVSYSGSGGEITIPSSVTTGGTTYPVTAVGIGAENSPVINAGSIAANSTLTIPDSVITINDGAFNNCYRLTGALVIPDSVTSIGASAFATTKITSLVIPDSVTSIKSSAFTGVNITSLVIPDSVTSIGNYAFSACSDLTGALVIPDSVTSIGDGTFRQTSITALVIPDSVTSIGKSSFRDCTELKSVIIPDSVTSIKDYAFSGCSHLSGVVLLGSPSISATAFSSEVVDLLNMGSLEISPGDYGISTNANVRDDIPLMGYMAPVSFSETVQNDGVVYELVAYLPALMLVGLMLGVVGVFMANRRV